MKEGYIVWNLTNYGDGFEFYGVYKSEKKALKQLRRVIRTRYGKCPRAYSDIMDFVYDKEGGDMGDSYRIDYFNENNGEE